MNHRHNQAQNKTYLEHLIDSIEKQRRFSIENAHKTNLYSNNEFVIYMAWFEDLLNIVKKNPPKGYVRTLLIHQTQHGQIDSVDYELFKKGEEPIDMVFEIVY